MSLSEIEKLKLENKNLRDKLSRNNSDISKLNILDRVHEWTWKVDTQGVYTYVCDNVSSVLGYLPEEILGKTPFDLMSEEEAQRIGAIFTDIIMQKKSFSKLANVCLHKNKSKVYTETSGEPIYDEDGTFLGYIGIDFNRTKEYKSTQVLQEENISLTRALHHQNELLLNVTNSISDCIFYKDTSYRYIGCNQAFSNFIGLPIDYIIGKTDYELFSTEYADLFHSMDERVLRDLEEHSNYEWLSHADGRKLYFLTQKAPLIDTKLNPIGLVGISKDITNEHELEKQLIQSNSFLVDAQSIAKVGHWDWDILTEKLFWSDEVYKIFGYTPQEFGASYEAFLATIHPDDKEMVSKATQEAVDNHSNYDIYHRIILPDGSEKIVHELGYALYDNKNIPIQMIGTVQDVTKFKAVQKELVEQKEAFEKIFEYSSDGATLIENGKFIACNQAVIDMMKASSREDFLELHPSTLSPEFQPDGRASYEKADKMMSICLKKGHKNFEWVHQRKNGENFWAEILLTRIHIKDKVIIHASWRDISERKALEETLLTSNKKYQNLSQELDRKVKEQSAQMIKQSRMAQMGELLSMIAHQWRQPLSSIAAIASAVKIKISLAKDSDISKENSDFLDSQMDNIETLTQDLSSTINDFRTLYKPDKIMKYFYLNEPIDKAFKLLEMSLNRDTIKIEKEYAQNISLLMHGNEVMQVVLNILKNAEDNFIEKNISNPSIFIRTFIDDLTANIMICDNGGGINEKIMENIFDPYFSTKDEKNGTGLGLYMSKIIIEQHHKGSLEVSNTDKGACFTIKLPLQ